MTLLAEPTTTRESVPAGSPERPRRRLLLPAVLAVVVLAWALLPFLVRLDQGVDPELPVDAGLMVSEYGDDGTFFLDYRHGDRVTLEVPVANQSPVPIRVERVAPTQHGRPLLVPVSAGGLPVTLSPGEQATVSLTFRYDNCRYYHERSSETMAGVVVTGSSLGRDFTESLTFTHPVTAHGQVILDCPDRTLVRGDDVRG